MDLMITDCQLVDVERGEVVPGAAVLVRDGVIVACGRDVPSGGDERVVDLAGRFLSPGLINCHVHLGLALPGGERARLAGESDAELALRMAANARRSLEAGVTTVRLVGEPRGVDFAVRRAVLAGDAVGPRIFTAGTILCCTGGHGHANGLEADGPDGFARAARLQIRQGADLVKVAVSGGIAGEHETIGTSQMTRAELSAVTEVAHSWGRKVAAHIGPVAAIRLAVECGVDSVEHGYQLDGDTAELMAARGVWYVPTIVVSRCKEYFERIGVPQWMMQRALAAGPTHLQALRNALTAGVRIAMGSDMLPFEPYDGTTASVRELELYAEAGMDPVEVLRSATLAGATWLGRESELGSIAPGRRADLVVTPGNPLESPSQLRAIEAVVLGGSVARDDHGLFAAWRLESV